MDNYYGLRLLANARRTREDAPARPQDQIRAALKRMGVKRTPGTNGEGRQVMVVIDGTPYRIWAIDVKKKG